MARTKTNAVAVLATPEECVRTMAELLIAITDIEVLIAEKDLAMAAALARTETRLDDAKARKIEAEVALKNYYYAHLAEIEKSGAKRWQLSNGVIGRRDNPPALKPLNRAWSWEKIKAAVRERWGTKYFHAPKAPELDKDKLKELDAEQLKLAGMKLESEETFYAEPDRAPAAAE
jgi:hypothetical protein